jgi:hypothetical protein
MAAAAGGQVPGFEEVGALYSDLEENNYPDGVTASRGETAGQLEAEEVILDEHVEDNLERREPDPEDSLGARGDFPTDGNDVESVEQMAPTGNISF